MGLKIVEETDIKSDKLGEFTKTISINGEIVKIVIERGEVASVGELSISNEDGESLGPNPILLKQEIQVIRPRVPVFNRYGEVALGNNTNDSERMIHKGSFLIKGRELGSEVVFKRISFLVRDV